MVIGTEGDGGSRRADSVSGSLGSLQALQNLLGGSHMGEAVGQGPERGEVEVFLAGAGGIRQEEHPMIPHVGVPGRGLATAVGHDPGDDQILNAQTAQYGLQVGIVKSAVAVLLHYLFPGAGSEAGMDFGFRGPLHAHPLPPPG